METTFQRQSGYNLNFKTIFLFVILICACCLLSIGYKFQINKLFESGISMVACGLLIAFLFYIFYEFFKNDTCEDLQKSGLDRLNLSANKGIRYFGQQANRGVMAMNKAMNNTMSNYNQQNPSQTTYLNTHS